MLETTTEFRVRYAETDQMGVVYHANYLIWCEVGRTDLLRQLDASYAKLERQGVYLAVSEARIRFHAAARYDDRVRVHTRLVQVRSRGVRFAYVVENAEDDTVLAKAEIDLICLDGDGVPRQLPVELGRLLRGAARGPDVGRAGEGTPDAFAGVDTRAES